MSKNIVETIVGFIVLLIAAVFIMVAYRDGIVEKQDGYIVNASFDSIDGIEVGSNVKISGIKIGKVIRVFLDNSSYTAQLEMQIDNSVHLPLDTSAEVLTTGIIGNKYVSLTPGTEEELLKENDYIEITQSPVNLENLIGKFIFGAAEKADKITDSKNTDEEKFDSSNIHSEGEKKEGKNMSDEEEDMPHITFLSMDRIGLDR